jgi:hypothetical protein
MADREGDRYFFLLWHFCIQKIATGQTVWFVASFRWFIVLKVLFAAGLL